MSAADPADWTRLRAAVQELARRLAARLRLEPAALAEARGGPSQDDVALAERAVDAYDATLERRLQSLEEACLSAERELGAFLDSLPEEDPPAPASASALQARLARIRGQWALLAHRERRGGIERRRILALWRWIEAAMPALEEAGAGTAEEPELAGLRLQVARMKRIADRLARAEDDARGLLSRSLLARFKGIATEARRGREASRTAELRRLAEQDGVRAAELERLREETAAQGAELERLAADLGRAQEGAKDAEAQLERASAEVAALRREGLEAREQGEGLAQEVRRLGERLSLANEDLKAAKARRDAALGELADLRQAQKEAAAESRRLAAELALAEERRRAAEAERDRALAERDRADAERDKALAERDRAAALRDRAEGPRRLRGLEKALEGRQPERERAGLHLRSARRQVGRARYERDLWRDAASAAAGELRRRGVDASRLAAFVKADTASGRPASGPGAGRELWRRAYGAVAGQVSSASLEVGLALRASGAGSASRAQAAVSRLAEAQDTLQALAALEADEAGPRPATAAQVVRDAVKRWSGELRARRIAVELGIDRLRGRVAQPAAARAALQLLLRNALEAAPSGGKVRVEGKDDGAFVVLAVRDSGPGFRAGDLKALWTSAHPRRAGHAGLGLLLARALAAAAGGSLTAANLPRSGARLELRARASS